ncbi:hypothetical protein HMPREF0379_0033 [[Eubacterium] yurii subsp. margaretiae ATCC 43715]|nr:hypothetical protein HMPREF0379_0033 [[Eubacterium] yurii subsp. margaretiae ATCC 43715]
MKFFTKSSSIITYFIKFYTIKICSFKQEKNAPDSEYFNT